MSGKKVSIIVAIYNSEKFLDKLINSIINQSYKNLEILLVDDGSPDNSGKICDEFSLKDSRIRVIHKKNGGACDARNVGLEHVTGEYVTIIDGDDWLSLDYVEYLVELIEKFDADMSMTDSIFTTRDQVQNKEDNINCLTNEEAACMIIYPKIPIGPWNKLYKTELIKNYNISFSVPWSGEGLYFSVMAAQYSKRVALGHRKIYNYRLNNAGSGLTNYKVVMGTNALDNIKYIGNNAVINSERFNNAVRWHIWKNYNFVLKLIIATNSINEHRSLFVDCKKNIRKMMVDVALHSELSIKNRLFIIIKSLFPVIVAKRALRKEQLAFKKDVME